MHSSFCVPFQFFLLVIFTEPCLERQNIKESFLTNNFDLFPFVPDVLFIDYSCLSVGKSQHLSSEVENVSPQWCKEAAARYPHPPPCCTAASLLYSTSPMSHAAVICLPG